MSIFNLFLKICLNLQIFTYLRQLKHESWRLNVYGIFIYQLCAFILIIVFQIIYLGFNQIIFNHAWPSVLLLAKSKTRVLDLILSLEVDFVFLEYLNSPIEKLYHVNILENKQGVKSVILNLSIFNSLMHVIICLSTPLRYIFCKLIQDKLLVFLQTTVICIFKIF